ncbi:hypothetical protein [Streptomyces zagrosensis]|uniref:Outer membrane murein-binding lipoprotein Lpp n=1 Tax=Streptomyces zagrosensis TaxID=1042984 RepID=A0A7W9V0E9_9ACTN|nr:hypothetical protein [Streptomyces zagrosensis]MBB5938085.1 outer membrane murein-binding lipoprotein Lpp [Streptomyces zagrosensis]
MRKAATIAGASVLAALLVTGCSSDSSGDKDSDKAKQPPTGAEQQPSDAPAGGDGAKVAGTYVTTGTGGQRMALAVQGKAAVLAGPHACTGTYQQNMLMLKCPDGNTDRTMGKVTTNADGSLTVDWDALSEDDVFVQTKPGDVGIPIPSGLPDLGGDLGDLKDTGGLGG